jgi:gamma-glutamylcyclotransferase (GGCT)/AIG2-like uncharacterized protein YtfP
MPHYFAYGANMDRDAMAVRCPGSRPLGIARLARHRFIITRDGYASVIRDPRAMVHGVIWDLALADIPALDRFEECAKGLYAKINQGVITEAGPRRALVYVGSDGEPGAPRPGYLEGVIASAETWNLPEAYRQELKRLLRGAGGPRPAAPAARPAVQPRAPAPRTTLGAPTRSPGDWRWKP